MASKKVLIVTPSLGSGGAERVAALLSKMICDANDVIIVSAYGNSDYDHGGVHISLKLNKDHFSVINLLRAFFIMLRVILKNKFDVAIDFRAKRNAIFEFIFLFFFYTRINKIVYTIHNLIDYTFQPKFIESLIYRETHVVVVSAGILKHSQAKSKSIELIKNAIDFDHIDTHKQETITMDKPFVLAAGRMDDNIKRFNHIIEAYATSSLPASGIHLLILGEGVVKKQLIALADELKCAEFVHFKGFQQNPFKYFTKAKFFILASEFEGFPMVLIESLACGTPVVSYDCPTGPSEIIQNENNGLLVENGNIHELTSAITRMHEDIVLYKTCKANTVKSVKHLSFDNIKNQWKKLIESANS